MSNYTVYPSVKMGKDVMIDDYVIIGLPPRGKGGGELETVIGDNALIRSHTVIYAGNRIGNNFTTGHGVLIREGNTIGDGVSIGSHSVIEHHVSIGERVRLHSQVFVPEYSVLEDECWLGPNVTLTNVLHPLCPKVKECLKGPMVKRHAKVGANCTLLPDIIIGTGALVGAGSVVVESVPDGKVVAGNPAKIIKDVSQISCPYHLIENPYEGA